jgi:hyaluronate lyase
MPGTTVNNAPRVTACISPSIYNTSPYAGGVAQGKYGTVGFILGYPKSAGAFESNDHKNIRAKKSYFLFDNEIVCLGSDIYDNSGTGVRTVVENRLWKDGDILSVNGVSIAPATVETEISARTMHFTSMGGYVFLDTNKILYSKSTNSYNNTHNDIKAEGTRDFLEISLSHGDGNVSGGIYSYVYLPEATVQETESYKENPDVEILARNTNIHSVIEKKLGVIGCNFFSENGGTVVNFVTDASAVTEIKANSECSVMVCKNADGSYTVSIADPTQLTTSLKVTVAIKGINEVISADNGITANVSNGVATFIVNTENARGTTFNVTVK